MKIKILAITPRAKPHWWSRNAETHRALVLIDGKVRRTVPLVLKASDLTGYSSAGLQGDADKALRGYVYWALVAGDQFADAKADKSLAELTRHDGEEFEA